MSLDGRRYTPVGEERVVVAARIRGPGLAVRGWVWFLLS